MKKIKMYNKWVQYDGRGKWYYEEHPLDEVYKLTPEEEKEFEEDKRKGALLDQQELNQLDEHGLTEEDKWILYKEKYFGKEVS